jgi:glucan phosphoethanolaminetransferase (alkaline phosphatase superfamily)
VRCVRGDVQKAGKGHECAALNLNVSLVTNTSKGSGVLSLTCMLVLVVVGIVVGGLFCVKVINPNTNKVKKRHTCTITIFSSSNDEKYQ